MVKVLLLGLVWVGGWMVIVGLGLGGAWFALWSVLILVTLVVDVRAHLADAKKREATRRRPMAGYVAGTESVRDEEPPAEVVSDSPSVDATPVAVERLPREARPSGGGAGRIDRFPGRCDDVSDPPSDNGAQQRPPEPMAKTDPAQSLDLSTKEDASAANVSGKSEARVPVPAAPITSQFDRPTRPVVFAPSEAATLPPQPVRPLGPAADPPRPSQPGSSPATPRAPRPPRPILRPEDFQIVNDGVPGFLYLARNEEHWEGLHKVGQTRNHPSGRVVQLNKEHNALTDIGEFELLDVVPVIDAYGAEQVLFQVLNDLRPVGGREFFIANRVFLSDAMQAAAQFMVGDDECLNAFYQDLDRSDHPDWPAFPVRYNHHSVGHSPGWAFIARNRFHRADTYRVSASVQRPDVIVERWNVFQRTVTPQIGFYDVVYAVPVANYVKARTIGTRALAPWRLNGQQSFFRGPLAELAASLESALRAATDQIA